MSQSSAKLQNQNKKTIINKILFKESMRQNSYADINTSLDRITKARSYAINVFSLLKKDFDNNIIELEQLSKVLNNPDVKKELFSPNATDDSRFDFVYEAYKHDAANKEISSASKKVCNRLIEVGHLALLPEITNHLKTFHNEMQDILTIRVISNPLVPEYDQQGAEAHIKLVLKKSYDFKKLNFSFIEDKTMIETGIKILIGDDCIDMSIENALSKLEVKDTTGNFDFEIKKKKLLH